MKFVLLALLLIFHVTTQSQHPCPFSNHNGSVYSNAITLSQNDETSAIPLKQGQNTQCYNFTLPYAFIRVPSVAISFSDFQIDQSKAMYFYIKPVSTESKSFASFIIRTLWLYTRWTHISFLFLAEDHLDIDSGYYQVDSGLLSDCESGKINKIHLMLKNQFSPSGQIHHQLFLHGFEIQTISLSPDQRSPYEIQLHSSSANVSGIYATLSVTTVTQINTVYISYVAYQKTDLKIFIGQFSYDSKNGQGFTHSPPPIPPNYARIYGLTGFIINNDQQKSIFLTTEWTGFEFYFKFGANEPLVRYLTFSYIFFTGSECEDCPGYPFVFNHTCVSVCPNQTFATSTNLCLTCGKGREWNGTTCVKRCPKGQFLNETNNECQCPEPLNWNGTQCLSCDYGRTYNKSKNLCECPRGFVWFEQFIQNTQVKKCIFETICPEGVIRSISTYDCTECEFKSFQKFNPRTGLCEDIEDPNAQSNNCPTDKIFIQDRCVCRNGTHQGSDGQTCFQCVNGKKWNEQKFVCECPEGFQQIKFNCQKICPGNQIWNQTLSSCICPYNQIWNGRSCFVKPQCSGGRLFDEVKWKCYCPTGYKWDTKQCQRCINGQRWDEVKRKCGCPKGTVWNRNRCRAIQACKNGQELNENIWQCQCPFGTVFNGAYCLSNPCQNGRIWDKHQKACVCGEKKYWNGRACVPPQIACNNGKIWDSGLYTCVCPDGTFPNRNKCDEIPTCKNGQVYNPLNNKCECPFGLIFTNRRCMQPNCPQNQYWNGNRCVTINCPPGSYYHKNKCVSEDHCQHSYYWNGEQCKFYQIYCPYGTVWVNQTCKSLNQCKQGYYQSDKGECEPLPQQCTPPTHWVNGKCSPKNNQCPAGTHYMSNGCRKSTPCSSGLIWDQMHLRCVCPEGKQSNGEKCIECSGGKYWVSGVGCRCKEGEFDFGSSCEVINQDKCQTVTNSEWKGNQCLCKNGFTKIGLQCICYGVQKNNFCDRCSNKPNSRWDEYFCRCQNGYTQINGNCVTKNGGFFGNDNPSSCAVASYFDPNHRKCVACPNGCLACIDSYECLQCRPEFHYHRGMCLERCGDGVKFVLECDDGNNVDGDGCSRDCHVEGGYICKGGSPDSADNCITFDKKYVSITQTGQIRMSKKIILNVKLDYLPEKLLKSADCRNKCESIIVGQIIEGDKSATSIVSQYLPGTHYSFSVQIDFAKPFIASFTVKLSISKAIGFKYFSPVSTAKTLKVEVNPSYLSKAEEQKAG